MIESWMPPQEETMPRRLTWREIADDLEARIRAGEFPPGTYIPSYRQVAERYDVSKATAGKAIALLTERGLIEEDRGRGNVVRDH
jgi:GntR family transcriptional regulator